MRDIRYLKTAPPSLADKVHKRLRTLIITGRIPSGTRLVESSLAKELGVSRTPVREALHKLALEGLVSSTPRMGYVVEEMSEPDIEDLFTTRMAIEQLVARRAVEKITQEEVELLESNLRKTDEVIQKGLTEKMINLDTEFHHIIYRACRSKRLYMICKMLSDHTLKFRIACIHLPDIARRAREGHWGIFRAIQSKDVDQVDVSIVSHLEITKKDILGYLREVREKSIGTEDMNLWEE